MPHFMMNWYFLNWFLMKNKLNTYFLLCVLCEFFLWYYIANHQCFFWQHDSGWSTQSNTHEYISIFRWGFDWESNPGHLILVVILYGNWLLCSGENMSSTGQRERISEKKTKWRLDLVISVSRTRVNLIYLTPQRQRKNLMCFHHVHHFQFIFWKTEWPAELMQTL